MGACNIEFEMLGAPGILAIQKAFKEQQLTDNRENGSGSYSGDFQTVDRVNDHTDKTFNSYDEAHDYCMKNAQKWDFVVAVRYHFIKSGVFVKSAKLLKLEEKLKDLNSKQNESHKTTFKMPAFKTCEGCESKINTKHMRGVKCPVCGEGDFRPLSVQRSELALKSKIADAGADVKAQLKIEHEKTMKKNGSVGTLIAGWGAC